MKFSDELGLPTDAFCIIQCTECKRYSLEDDITMVSKDEWLCDNCFELYVLSTATEEDIQDFMHSHDDCMQVFKDFHTEDEGWSYIEVIEDYYLDSFMDFIKAKRGLK